MEAVAALSLACNIIQVIDSSVKVIERCTQFYKHGTTIAVEDLRYMSDQLSHTTDALNKAQPVQVGTQLSKGDAELVELGKKVHDAAESLSKEVNSLKSAPGAGRRAALVKTLALKWRASRIEELKRRLEGLVQILDNKILVLLSEKLSVAIRNQGEIPKMLDERQDRIAHKIAEGTTSVEQLIYLMDDHTRAHITQEHIATRKHIDTIDKKINQLVDIQSHKAVFDKFMESLHFPEINLRQDKIEDAHEKTFEWIFKRHEDTSQRWHNFPDWLHNDQPLYWILGKAGSGKSTLMNFLVHDRRTLEALESSGQPTTILSFFFWEAGIELQKSRVGLLRSLIYQLLKAIDQQKALGVWVDVVQRHIPPLPTIWTSRNLLALLQLIVQAVDQRFCFFLDGLDEFQDEVDGTEAIRSLQDVLKDQSRVKLCISSRPQINLKELYQDCPNIVIQTLTEPDIRLYVEDKLLEGLGDAHTTQASSLVDEVVFKAEGVFLWVTLAVQSLLRGMKNEDHWGTLRERLDQLPSGIFDLYTHMWKRMADDYPIYAKEAALYLGIIQHLGEQSLVQMAIMVDEELRANFSNPAATWGIKQLEVKVKHEKTEKRITACCAGFLEVGRHDNSAWSDATITSIKERLNQGTLEIQPETIERWLECARIGGSTTVDFVHRTAVEYLKTSAGQELLQVRPYTQEELVVQSLRSALISYFLAPPLSAFHFVEDDWNTCLSQIKSNAATDFCSELEAICKKLLTWGWWDMNNVEPRCLMRGRRDEVDHVKVFMGFTHPQYVMKKLNEEDLGQNREYVTELLAWWVTRPIFYQKFDHVMKTGLLLLQLGADPNQMLHEKPGLNSQTIWTAALLFQLFGLTGQNIIMAMLEAGADPNSSHISCLECDTYMNMAHEIQEPTLSRSFILSKRNVLDLVSGIEEDLANSITSILLQLGATCAQKQVLWFQPPMSWWVFRGDILKDELRPLATVPGGDPFRLDFYTFGQSLEEFRESFQHDFRFFSNGLDALHAAGWTDDEIRTTPGLRGLWEELSQLGEESQHSQRELPVPENSVENE